MSAPAELAKQTPADILRIADRLEPALRDVFLEVFDALARQIPVDRLTGLLEAGNVPAINQLINDMRLPQRLTVETQTVLVQAFVDAANTSGFDLLFTVTNPAAIRWAETHTGQLIVGVSSETKKAIAEIVRTGVAEGMDVRTQARSIRNIIGLTARDAAAVDRYLTGLLEEDTPVERAHELAEKMKLRLLRRRAENIARTETATAVHRGQYQAWQDAADAGLFNPNTTQVVWIATGDERVCPICSVLDGQVVGFGQRFVTNVQATSWDIKPAGTLHGTPQQDILVTGTKPLKEPIVTQSPPSHVNCRCDVGLVFD